MLLTHGIFDDARYHFLQSFAVDGKTWVDVDFYQPDLNISNKFYMTTTCLETENLLKTGWRFREAYLHVFIDHEVEAIEIVIANLALQLRLDAREAVRHNLLDPRLCRHKPNPQSINQCDKQTTYTCQLR